MAVVQSRRKRQKLSDYIVEDVKRWIVVEGKQPGDRLPNEKELIAQTGYSKSTVREALKALEVAGIIAMRTGPNGGAYVQQVTYEHASGPLRNFLHFQHLEWDYIYQLRRVLEPELAESIVGRLTPEQFARLEENINFCAHAPLDSKHLKAQRQGEIEFHSILAESCPNPVLRFICRFLNDLLIEFVSYKSVESDESFRGENVEYHGKLLEALQRHDKEAVGRLMSEHMANIEIHVNHHESLADKISLLMNSGPH